MSVFHGLSAGKMLQPAMVGTLPLPAVPVVPPVALPIAPPLAPPVLAVPPVRLAPPLPIAPPRLVPPLVLAPPRLGEPPVRFAPPLPIALPLLVLPLVVAPPTLDPPAAVALLVPALPPAEAKPPYYPLPTPPWAPALPLSSPPLWVWFEHPNRIRTTDQREMAFFIVLFFQR